jgi:hypothetical protein
MLAGFGFFMTRIASAVQLVVDDLDLIMKIAGFSAPCQGSFREGGSAGTDAPHGGHQSANRTNPGPVTTLF